MIENSDADWSTWDGSIVSSGGWSTSSAVAYSYPYTSGSFVEVSTKNPTQKKLKKTQKKLVAAEKERDAAVQRAVSADAATDVFQEENTRLQEENNALRTEALRVMKDLDPQEEYLAFQRLRAMIHHGAAAWRSEW